MSKNHFVSGKGPKAVDAPPAARAYAVVLICPACELPFHKHVHLGRNEVLYQCACGAVVHAVVFNNEGFYKVESATCEVVNYERP